MKTIISKIQLTSIFKQWWQEDITDLFTPDFKDCITILNAIIYEGSLYLIYSYTLDDNGVPVKLTPTKTD